MIVRTLRGAQIADIVVRMSSQRAILRSPLIAPLGGLLLLLLRPART